MSGLATEQGSNTDYLQIHKDFVQLQNNWNKNIQVSLVEKKYSVDAPILTEVEFTGNLSEYKQCLLDAIEYLEIHKPALQEQLTIIRNSLTEDVCQKWLQAAIMMNEFYFEHYATEYKVEAWLPLFLAESTSRVYVRQAVKQLQTELTQSKVKNCCPACGEPPRLAIVGKNGSKELVCPRCHYTWNSKKIGCSHCQNDDHETLIILKPEGQETEQIVACNRCKNYTKIIDTRVSLERVAPEILDLMTIHLDYIAQEEGYSVGGLQPEA